MGNMPNKWIGRATALVSAAISAVIGWAIGAWIGDKLANGFVFDWYVHPAKPAYDLAEVLPHVASTSAFAAFLTVTIGVFLTAAVTRFTMKRLRYTPPRYASPVSVDVHFGRLAAGAILAAPILGALLAYTLLATPLFAGAATGTGGAVIERVSNEGFVLLLAGASSLFSFLGSLLAHLTTESGLVSGRIVPKSDRNLIARVSVFGMKNAKTTVALVLAVTMLAGASASTITTNVDVADVLPRGDPNTDAAHNLTDAFKSSFTQQVTWQFRAIDITNLTQMQLYRDENAQKLPERVTDSAVSEGEASPGGDVGRPENVTDELYIRAMAEVVAFVLTQDPFAGSVGAPDFYKLINWTMAGGNNASEGHAAFELPGTDEAGELRYATVESGVVNVGAVFSAVDAVTAPDWAQTAVLVTVGSEYSGSTKYIGERALEVREEWLRKVEAGETRYRIFGEDNPPLFSVDLPIANAHASELTSHDFKILLPAIAIFIAITLFIAFRNAVSVVATFSMLSIAVTWTFGVMGALEIPLNTINLATVPLIMGVGIDYGIHMMNEYQELRGSGKSPEQAWIAAGGGSSLALFVGLLTTLAGLMVMVVSPSLLVAQLGILAIVALISCYLLAVLFLPAVVTIMGERKKQRHVTYEPSRVMPLFATGVSRARWAVAIVLVLMAGAAVASASSIRREAFGDPPRNWLEDDELRNMHQQAIEGFYDRTDDAVKANVLIIEGDITDPDMHTYINGVTATLRQFNATGWTDANNETHDSRVIADTLRDLPFLVNTYLTVRDGVPGAGQFLGTGALQQLFARDPTGSGDPTGRTAQYPDTREELQAVLDEVFESPLYQFANLFLNAPEYDMTVIVFSVNAGSYEDAEEVWNEVQAALLANEAIKPEGVRTSFFGNTAINYLFVAKQVPWLGYMSIATVIIVSIVVFLFTRDIRATAVVTLLNGLTASLWIGLLPMLDIGLAINLTLPLVFIFCMGSDYGLHLAMRCKKTGDPLLTFEGVGKGVLYSFITTFGSFLIFTQISDLAGRRGMIATALAIAVVFVTTMLVVPIFYPIKKKHLAGREGHTRNVPVVEPLRAPHVEVWSGDRKEIRPLDARE